MTTNRSRALMTAAALLLGAAVSPALAQRHTNTSGHRNTAPAIRHDRQPGWSSMPNIRMGDWGVRSQAPRAIGKVNGTLLTPPSHDNGLGTVHNGAQLTPNGGNGFFRSNDGRWLPRGNGAGVSIGPSGVNAGVHASGDRWGAGAVLRSSIDHSWLHYRTRNRWNDFPYRYGGLYSPYYGNGYYPSYFGLADSYYADPFVMYGNPPAPQQPVVDPNATIPEQAALRLRQGKPKEAIVLLRPYADANPYDYDAARALAVALIDARRTKEGIAVMALVYEQNPKLARVPLSSGVVGPERELRDLVVRVVEFGHRSNTSSAWLTAAVLMQGEGREDTAFKMIERADTVGLDANVSKALRGVLKP